jgi:hypothetical protein
MCLLALRGNAETSAVTIVAELGPNSFDASAIFSLYPHYPRHLWIWEFFRGSFGLYERQYIALLPTFSEPVHGSLTSFFRRQIPRHAAPGPARP